MGLRLPAREAMSARQNIDTAPRRGLRRPLAAAYIGVSPTKFDEMVADGRMPNPIRIDGCVIWDRVALDNAFDTLADNDASRNPWDDDEGAAA